MAIEKDPPSAPPPEGADAATREITADVTLRKAPPAAPPPPPPEEPHPIPGLEILGRGIHLKPRQPYELKQRLVKWQRPNKSNAVYCPDVGKSYLVPKNFEVNHSPPIPANQTLNQTVIEQSWESLESHFDVSADVAAGVGTFTLRANYGQISQFRREEEAYYAFRTSFIPSWTVDCTEPPETKQLRADFGNLNKRVEQAEGNRERAYYFGDLIRLRSLLSKEPQTADDLEEILELADEYQFSPKDRPDTLTTEQLPQVRKWKERWEARTRDLFERNYGKDFVQNFELLSLLCEPIEYVPESQLKSLRSQIEKLLPADQKNDLPQELSAESLAKLRAHYGIRSASLERDKRIADIRSDFYRKRRAIYEDFFQRHGTHFVKRVWVGGVATLAISITKSEGTSIHDVRAGINAAYEGLEIGASSDRSRSIEKQRQHSTCTVFGKGGDESELAALNTLNLELYNRWLKSVKDNPQVIEIEVIGIWSLLTDETTKELTPEATRLQEAYRKSYEFEPTTAIYSVRPNVVTFIKKAPPQAIEDYSSIDKTSSHWDGVHDAWPNMEKVGFDRIDAAFAGASLSVGNSKSFRVHSPHLFESNGSDQSCGFSLDEYACFFRKDRCFWLHANADVEPEKIRPAAIGEVFPGVKFDGVDAALNCGPEWIYFFRGDQYARFNWTKNKADFTRRKFGDFWKGVTFDRIDAAIYWGNGKVYFFRGDRYIVYDMVTCHADPGFPKYLPSSYVEDWKIFD